MHTKTKFQNYVPFWLLFFVESMHDLDITTTLKAKDDVVLVFCEIQEN